ncbi:MAG: GTP-binding protein, partial [Verrucomicrobiota bacterium]
IAKDMAALQLSTSLPGQSDVLLVGMDERMIEKANGCAKSTVREDLLIEIAKIAAAGNCDHLLLESTGVSDSLSLTESFNFRDEACESLGDIARIDAIVNVIDGPNFLNDYSSPDTLQDRGCAVNQHDTRTVVDLLVDQIEFANVILLNKVDLISKEDGDRIQSMMGALNPQATIYETVNSEISPDCVIATGLYDRAERKRNQGWLDPLLEKAPATGKPTHSNFVYKRRVPFHPERLYRLFDQAWPGVIRSKGLFWLATRPELAGYWSQAGSINQHQCLGFFWAAMPRESWPADPETLARIKASFQLPYGDRRQEFALIGSEMDQSALTEMLDSALLTDKELATEHDEWAARFSDPFPKWDPIHPQIHE